MHLFRMLFSLYAMVSLLYVGSILVRDPLSTLLAKSLDLPSLSGLTEIFSPNFDNILEPDFARANLVKEPTFLEKEKLSFSLSENNYPTPAALSVEDELFLSRAFSQAMRPSKIIPFYYRASGSFSRNDITISTLVTGNRFEVLKQLVQRYQGPVSVAVHVTDTVEERPALLLALHELYTTTPGLSRFLDVHLVLDTFERQFNTWRNVARLFAAHRTDFVLMLDVDFALCTDFRSRILSSARSEVVKRLRLGSAALVIPAFEYTKSEDGRNETNFPRSKEDLLSLVHSGRLGMFHATWKPGHNSTNYKRYYASVPGEIYKIADYQQAYEPYVIFRNAGTPWCDERFIGYGGNKAACLFEMWLSGMGFFVLSDDFIIHQSHAYAESTRRHERKYNRMTYLDFREEACLRYLRYLFAAGTLDTSRGYNLQSECRKIKGFSRVAAEIISVNSPKARNKVPSMWHG